MSESLFEFVTGYFLGLLCLVFGAWCISSSILFRSR